CALPLRPPRPTLFPYTTLFRSVVCDQHHGRLGDVGARFEVRLDPAPGRCPLLEMGKIVGRGFAKRSRLPLAFPSPEQRQNNHLRSEEHTSELQSRENLVCRLLL